MRNKFIARWVLAILFFGTCGLILLRPTLLRLGWGQREVASAREQDFALHEISRQLGIRHVHQMENIPVPAMQKVLPWLTATGAGVAVADVDGDGWQDLFFPSTMATGENHLYVNRRGGQFFEDQTKKYGLDKAKFGITRAAFFDCDNDGAKELFLNTVSCPRLFKLGKGRAYQEIPFGNSGDGCYWTTAINIFDFNGDGLLDIVMGAFYDEWGRLFSRKDFMPTSLVDGTNGGPVELFENKGSCRFEKVQNLIQGGQGMFSHSVGVGDFRNTSQAEIWIATDFRKDRVYTRTNDGHYSLAVGALGPTASNTGMNTEVGYGKNETLPYIFVTHAYRSGFNIGGNMLWQYSPERQKFLNHSEAAGVRRCGWSWGGKFLDLNNDSNLDLVVANGHISASREKDYFFKLTTIGSSIDRMTSNFERWPDMRGISLSGYERDCLYVSRGGTFENVAEAMDFDPETLDGRAVAVIDIDNSGSQSLVVVNQKQRPYLYKVEQRNGNNWIGFHLRGTKSNRDAVGAKVQLTLDNGDVLTRANYPLNAFSAQSDDRIHFGLGTQTVKGVVIHWPRGGEQVVSGFKLKAYNEVVEAEQ